jgi:hypothetical protein
MSSKKPCINYPSCTYTGKEQSPLRFGLSAEGYSVNSVLEGYDKHLWVVEIKNNKKVWVKREETFSITPEEPVIKDIPIPLPPVIPEEDSSTLQPIEKKTTDYNLFLSYRLSQLKETHPDNDNKTNFAKVIEEWKNIKNKPEDLKKVIEEAKQYAVSKPAKKPSSKKTSNAKPTTPEEAQTEEPKNINVKRKSTKK